MSENRDFGFCPRCGALMQNGVCISCGYGGGRQPRFSDNNQGQHPSPGIQGGAGVSGGPGTSPVYIHATPAKTKNHTVAIVIGIIAGVLILLGILVGLIVAIANSAQSGAGSRGRSDYYDNDYYGGYDDDYDYGYYEPDEDDPYYREIVDWTRTDLDYHIQWAVESVDPDDPDDDCTYYTTYPILEQEDTTKFDAVNDTIRSIACRYRDIYWGYEEGISTFGYVTFMDEEKISVVFKHNFYNKNVTEVRLDARSFWIESGEEIAPEEMTDIDQELAMRFQAQDKIQNNGVEYVQDLTADYLLPILKDPNRAVFFYTPVGLEVGFNYETGWVTVTLKEQAL